jgi:hypothetical protein
MESNPKTPAESTPPDPSLLRVESDTTQVPCASCHRVHYFAGRPNAEDMAWALEAEGWEFRGEWLCGLCLRGVRQTNARDLIIREGHAVHMVTGTHRLSLSIQCGESIDAGQSDVTRCVLREAPWALTIAREGLWHKLVMEHLKNTPLPEASPSGFVEKENGPSC